MQMKQDSYRMLRSRNTENAFEISIIITFLSTNSFSKYFLKFPEGTYPNH